MTLGRSSHRVEVPGASEEEVGTIGIEQVKVSMMGWRMGRREGRVRGREKRLSKK